MTRIVFALLVSFSTTLLASPLVWAESVAESSSKSSWTIESVDIGLDRSWKIGYPTRCLINLVRNSKSSSGPQGRGIKIEWETVDGEGVPVVFTSPIKMSSDSNVEEGQGPQKATFEIVAKNGRRNRSMSFRVLDEANQVLDEHVISDAERGNVLPVGQPWVVGIGKGMNLGQAAMQSTRGNLSSYTSIELSEPMELPLTSEGYSGVDLLVISTADDQFLRQISLQQSQAIVDWVLRGGHTLVSVGRNADVVKELPWLSTMLQEKIQGLVSSVDPGVLESYLASQKRLEKLTCARFETGDTRDAELSLLTIDRKKIPLLFKHAYGFGQVQVIATDLDAGPIKDWPDRKLLIDRLFNEHWSSTRDDKTIAANRASFLGYDDLSGQLRATLDTFPRVYSGSLPLISTLIALLSLLLGPFDYFILSRAWNRPVWTWWSLLLWSLTGVAGIGLLASSWKPNKQIVNSIEFVDYDYLTQTARGAAFVHQYSGKAGRYDIASSVRPITFAPKLNSDEGDSLSTTHLTWSGQPGQGLSGFDSTIRTDFGFPVYQIALNDSAIVAGLNRDGQSRDGQNAGALTSGSKAIGLGMPTAASKSFRVDWIPNEKFLNDKLEFHTVGETDFIEGNWTNPLKSDLLNGILVYRGWLYRLPGRIRSQDNVRITANDIPKDLARVLQRRQVVKDIDVGVPWDAADVKNLDRLVEMLSLHKAAGGSAYTGLHHRYLKELDLTSHLRLNRAVLIGQLPEPVLDWSVKQGVEKLVAQNGQRSAFMRFVIPVTSSRK